VRRHAPRPLAAALERITPELAPASRLARVQAVWPEVAAGPRRGEAEPVAESAGTVTVECRSAVWAQELELLSGDLLERLNGALGGPSVTRLRFVAGGRRRPG
jgi:hypothetical protein